MNLIMETMILGLDLTACTMLVRSLFDGTIKMNIKYWAYVIVILILNNIMLYNGQEDLSLLLIIIGFPCLLVLSSGKEDRRKLFSRSLLVYLLLFIPISVITILAGLLELRTEYLIPVICSIFDIVIIIYLKRKKVFLNHITFHKSEIISCIFINLFSILILILTDPANEYFDYQVVEQRLLVALVAVSVAVLNILFITALYKSKVSAYYKIVSQLNTRYMEDELRYFNEYKNKNTELMRFRHDLKNHLLCLKTLCQEEKYNEVPQYIDGLFDDWQETGRLYHVGNDIIDAVINGKAFRLKEHHIELNITGYFKDHLALPPVDLCTIFSNAIDNAIEANIKIAEPAGRYLNIMIKSSDNFYIISFTNPVAARVEIDSALIITSEKGAGHGFGLRNIRQAAERSQGYIELQSEDTLFTLDVVLPL